MAQFITEETEDKHAAIKQLQDTHLDASFTIGAEAANVINVAIQLKKDKSQVDLDRRAAILAYLATDANGDSPKAADANLSSAIGTDGAMTDLATDGPFLLVSEADGDIDIDFTKTDAGTFYLILVMPNGRLVASGAITFA